MPGGYRQWEFFSLSFSFYYPRRSKWKRDLHGLACACVVASAAGTKLPEFML